MGFVPFYDFPIWTHNDGDWDNQHIIFVNSLGSDYRIWDAVVSELEDYYCFRYDLRGHGLSGCPPAPYSIRDNVDDLFGVLDDLLMDKFVMVGISVGGMIAMEYAATHPLEVDALILLDTFPKIGTADMWNERINTLREHGMAHLGEAILARWFAPGFKHAHPADYLGYYNMLTRMPVEGYTGTCEAIRDADLTEAAKTITCPTLVLCGAEDQSTPPELVRSLTDLITGSRYVEIEGAGHLPPIENPTATADAIHTFLKDVL